MKLHIKLLTIVVGLNLLSSCQSNEPRLYNEGVNIIPIPVSLKETNTERFTLSTTSNIFAGSAETKIIAEFFSSKLNSSTGYSISIVDSAATADIELSINPTLDMKSESYTLVVTPERVTVVGKDAAGLFYGMQSFMQLLPAEIESTEKIGNIEWSAPSVEISDSPRFDYRGVMLDVCRHFMPVEFIKKQLDVMAMFKINRMHWHLTEDQAWRIEIKKYPLLTEIGSKRIEGEGVEYGGFYTQEQVKDIVAYAAERQITIVPEFELPGHELAAIAAYPELSCKGEPTSPRIVWGVEDVVMCPGKESTFEFLENIIAEIVPLFPGEYFHIGGDECPKSSWTKCPLCQKRIKDEKLTTKDGHSSEERLQSYVIRRIDKVLQSHNKKLIGWDEILEGGLSPNASVMSWRGESGGIAAANMGHSVVMTPSSGGLYIDHYQGDSKVEPTAIGGYSTLEKIYSYNPTPKELVESGKEHFVMGVQANLWTEYMYTTDIMEYRLYPRILALAEVGWSPLDKKDFKEFSRRVNNAYVRLDYHDINYHIPQPEQPNGSVNFVAFADSVAMEFTTTRPIKMVYTLNGDAPTSSSTEYTKPIVIKKSTTLKIASVLLSGKLSPIRTITVEKQSYAPATVVENPVTGLLTQRREGMFLNKEEFEKERAKRGVADISPLRVLKNWRELVVPGSNAMRNIKQAVTVTVGYIDIPQDGVYFFYSNNDEVWIGDKLIVNNDNAVKRYSRNGGSIALAKGLHPITVLFLGNIIGGWPSNWSDGGVSIRNANDEKYKVITPNQMFHVQPKEEGVILDQLL